MWAFVGDHTLTQLLNYFADKPYVYVVFSELSELFSSKSCCSRNRALPSPRSGLWCSGGELSHRKSVS